LTLNNPKEFGAESDKIGQGRESARAFLEKNPKILDKLIKVIREKSAEEPEEQD